MKQIKQSFFDLFQQLSDGLLDDEILLANALAEDSDFVQMNYGKIRNAGSVHQIQISLRLILENRQASAQFNIGGNEKDDLNRANHVIESLRNQIRVSPKDPFLLINTEIHNSELIATDSFSETHLIIEEIISSSKGLDLVGLFSNGIIYRGFANSLGQRNWHSRSSFNFDWSCYIHTDKAVKSRYSDFNWNSERFLAKIETIHKQLEFLSKTALTINPDNYRVYLAPAAVSELMMTLAWQGFGAKNHKTQQTPLQKLASGQVNLHSGVSLFENNADGLIPGFTHNGFKKPPLVTLIDKGQLCDMLINSRSASEYNLSVNADIEIPESLDFLAGDLARSDVFRKLDTGLYINNLWYSNFSDMNQCAITGMTRFACFLVENGQIKAPINPLRFDDSLFNILGNNLEAISIDREWILDTDTYERRSLASMRLPGLLIDNLKFTL